MTNKMSSKQGESTDLFTITVKGLTDYTNYYSDLTVINADTDTVVLGPTRINPADNKFSVSFTPDQTLALPVDSYVVVLEVVRDIAGTIEFKREISWPLKITESILNS